MGWRTEADRLEIKGYNVVQSEISGMKGRRILIEMYFAEIASLYLSGHV